MRPPSTPLAAGRLMLLLVATLLLSASAFLVPATISKPATVARAEVSSQHQHQHQQQAGRGLVMLSPGKPNLGKGGALLQKPQLQTATRVAPPKRKEKTEEQFETKEEESEKFAVVLVGDKDYDQGHVVKVLCKVIAGLGAMKAVAAFQEAQTKGKAIVLITDEESAETVAELICRNKPPVIADVEPLQKGQ